MRPPTTRLIVKPGAGMINGKPVSQVIKRALDDKQLAEMFAQLNRSPLARTLGGAPTGATVGAGLGAAHGAFRGNTPEGLGRGIIRGGADPRWPRQSGRR